MEKLNELPDIVIFAGKTVVVCIVIYICFRIILYLFTRMIDKVGINRHKIEKEYSCLSDTELLKLIRNPEGSFIHMMACLNVAMPRIEKNIEIKKAVQVLEHSEVELIRMKAKDILQSHAS